MNKLKWINFLHFYQPPFQQKKILDEIVSSSYSFILRVLKDNPNLRCTFNINASLIDQFKANHLDGLLNDFAQLHKRGQIEVVSSAAFHTILPLLPKKEIEYQIQYQNDYLKEIFGKDFFAKGFFSPEMAINKKTLKAVKNMGFEWIILDQISTDKQINYHKKYIDKNSGLTVIFRDRTLSEMYPPAAIINLLDTETEKDIDYIVTATDAELYGHHHIDKYGFFESIAKKETVNFLLISDYLKNLSEEEKISVRDSTWSTTEKDLEEHNPYPLWDDPHNMIHRNIWNLAKKAINLVYRHSKDSNYKWAREHLNNGLASCTFWWCSKKQPSPFCPITWNPDEVEKGVRELIKIVRSLESLPNEEKKKCEKIFSKINNLVWQEHWK